MADCLNLPKSPPIPTIVKSGLFCNLICFGLDSSYLFNMCVCFNLCFTTLFVVEIKCNSTSTSPRRSTEYVISSVSSELEVIVGLFLFQFFFQVFIWGFHNSKWLWIGNWTFFLKTVRAVFWEKKLSGQFSGQMYLDNFSRYICSRMWCNDLFPDRLRLVPYLNFRLNEELWFNYF